MYSTAADENNKNMYNENKKAILRKENESGLHNSTTYTKMRQETRKGHNTRMELEARMEEETRMGQEFRTALKPQMEEDAKTVQEKRMGHEARIGQENVMGHETRVRQEIGTERRLVIKDVLVVDQITSTV